jgi:hypothetical protein
MNMNDDMLRKALELGDRQADELARLSFANARHRRVLFRALHYARYGKISRVIEILEQELARERKVETPHSANVRALYPDRP